MNYSKKNIIKICSWYDTDGSQILTDKDMKRVTINVFYMFKKISTDTENILKKTNKLNLQR